LRVDKIDCKTAPVEFRLSQTSRFAVCLKTFCRLLAVGLGLLLVSGIFGPEVYASETKLVDLKPNCQAMWDMPAISSPLSEHRVAFNASEYGYRFMTVQASGTDLYPEIGQLPPMLATLTPTPPGQNASDKGYLVYLLVGGLVILMALFIVVVVKVLKKLKDLSNGR
jgi:hypothetical protein